MTQAAEVVSAQAVELPPAERMRFVERMLDSLDEPDATLDAAWATEAEDRLAAYWRGEVKAVALSEVIVKCQTTPRGA